MALSKRDIRELAHDLGIDVVGLASAEPVDLPRVDGGFLPGGAPEGVLAGARTVICAGQGYLSDEPDPPSRPGEPLGRVAPYTWRDHYRDLKERLKVLAGRIRDEGAHARTLVCGSLAEKPFAERAGLGFYGKHGILVTPEWGSWVVLGEIVTDLVLEPDAPASRACGACTLCVDACPTRAIVAPGVLDRGRCLQHLSNHPIPPEWWSLWGDRLYGCAVCQEVCPRNRHVARRKPRSTWGIVGPRVPLLPLLGLSEVQYRVRYADNQMGANWIRHDAILRNACLALGNLGDPAAVPALREVAFGDAAPMVREAAGWALGRLGAAG